MEQILKVVDLTKKYGDFTAVKKLSLEVFKGEIFGFLGPNGAGKTTTIECILGTKKYNNGKVELLGQNPEKNRKELFERVGVQFQASYYPERIKVYEICELTASLYKTSIDWRPLVKEFDLDDKTNQFVDDLSGGEKQKLSIILALINDPEIIFLDELTTGLDPRARRDVWKYIRKLKDKDMTIFLTSHYMDEVVNLCDRITIIDKGVEIVNGSIEDVIAESKKDNLEDAYLYFVGEDCE